MRIDVMVKALSCCPETTSNLCVPTDRKLGHDNTAYRYKRVKSIGELPALKNDQGQPPKPTLIRSIELLFSLLSPEQPHLNCFGSQFRPA
jgi:hypothetical protein